MGMVASAADAQDVRYKTKSKTELHALGFLGGLFDGETEEEISIKNFKMRSDRDKQSTITDLDGERIINIDHKKKEYTIITFADMAEMMSSLGTRMEEGTEAREMPEGDHPEFEVEFDLKVEDTGKTKKIDGRETSQRIMILETRFAPKDASADTLPSGSFFAVTDMWLADEIPEMKAQEAFMERMGELMRGNMGSVDMAGMMSKVMDSYPQVGAAMERSKEELSKVDGFAMASTVHLVTVPKDMDLDLALVLGEKKEEKKKGGFGGFLKKMAEAVPTGDMDAKTDAKPEQKTIMSVHSSTNSISTKSRKSSYFDPPSKYKEVAFQSPMEQMEEQ
jgi:hypothetical protein